jgi:tetratricopeptide (TPR) repeat protein
VPSNSDINFLLGYLYFQKSQFQDAENYLVNATKADLHHVQALTLLGRLRILREDYKGSSEVLEQALAAESENWTAHNLLADAYLRLQEFEKARQQAQLAIETVKGAGNAARIPLAEALASLGRNPEALEALATFLQNAPQSPIAPQVRDLMAEIKRRDSDPQFAELFNSTAHVAPAHLLVATDSDFFIRSWEPPGIDEAKPLVATGVVCPYEKVIEETGKRMAQFVDDVAQFSAIEDVLHEDLDELGKPITKKSIQFDYVASISADYPGFLGVDEYRNDRNDEAGVGEFPDQIATRGLPALALVFHPDMRGNFQIVCEGLGEWNRQATRLLHFRQREDRPNRIKSSTKSETAPVLRISKVGRGSPRRRSKSYVSNQI